MQMYNMKTIELKIRQVIHRRDAVMGRLTINGNYVADTAERAQYQLPAGRYDLELVPCVCCKRQMIRIWKPGEKYRPCPDCQHCRLIRWGNGVYRLPHPTVLIGKYRVPGVLTQTRELFNLLFERLRKSIDRDHKAYLIIQPG